MSIKFGGINTGLPANLVDQLVEVEKAPIKNVEARKTKTQSKLTLITDLDGKIKGISDRSAEKLLQALKSVKQVKEASLEEITAVLGPAKAQLVWEYFHGA